METKKKGKALAARVPQKGEKISFVPFHGTRKIKAQVVGHFNGTDGHKYARLVAGNKIFCKQVRALRA